jgi:hypothetical protein
MEDIGFSAFSLFFMQSESFLSFQNQLEKGHGTSNCQTLFGMKKIPTDNYIRLMLDPVSPEALQPCFDQVIEKVRQGGGLKAFQRLGYGCWWRWIEPSISVRKNWGVRIVLPASDPTVRQSNITPRWRRRSWPPAITGCCR